MQAFSAAGATRSEKSGQEPGPDLSDLACACTFWQKPRPPFGPRYFLGAGAFFLAGRVGGPDERMGWRSGLGVQSRRKGPQSRRKGQPTASLAYLPDQTTHNSWPAGAGRFDLPFVSGLPRACRALTVAGQPVRGRGRSPHIDSGKQRRVAGIGPRRPRLSNHQVYITTGSGK